ncbi:bifunctional (p)ppGpp synthetase/guanosine-3',5'-bis(diphosphate) 3'-pyrophosphohydrolase [Microbacteriaceae bacterium VKM Ac-2854]|nr:bifunctional (p)ppGpp synthetase/guanosine-3',5'-bis(diphosphate) 3'-pyrophosphohydrolase [Microbacteriaceae bacterium VKM Ac-2854]
MNDTELIALADAIAERAHAAQVDKAGEVYIGHPRRVAAHVRRLFPEAPAGVVAAALLHDVIEDTDITPPALIDAGIPLEVVATVDAVTKRVGEPVESYFERVRAHAWAVMVKTADLTDNTDPERVARLDPATRERLAAKYERAERLLRVVEDGSN